MMNMKFGKETGVRDVQPFAMHDRPMDFVPVHVNSLVRYTLFWRRIACSTHPRFVHSISFICNLGAPVAIC